MVYHLDKMAKNNADLNLLMTTLAAGKGSHDQVLKFREYMNKAKALDAVEEWQPATSSHALLNSIQYERVEEKKTMTPLIFINKK